MDLDLLSGALQVAEAQVRWLMAEALPPASQYRVEREATLRAHATLRGVQVKRTIELPPGWAELVEVDDAIDALLERLVRQEAAQEVVALARTPIPEVPPLPTELARPAPPASHATVEAAPVTAPVTAAPADPPAEPAEPAEPAVAWSDPWSQEYAGYEQGYDEGYEQGYDQGYQADGYDSASAAGYDSASAAGYDSAASAGYDSAASAGYDSAASAGYDHAHTAAGEPGGGWARAAAESTTWSEPASPDLPPDEPTGEAPNEVELPVPDELLGGLDAFPSDASPWPEPDLGFGGSDFAGLDEAEDADLDPYAQRGDERAVLSLGDIGLDAPPRRRDDDLFDEVVERTHAELTLDLPRDWEDDENTEVTEVVTRGNRPAAAAVQIHADGTAHVVGTDEPDDPSLASAIELGDESSQADVRLDPIDGITGSFSISRLGLHDDDDDEDDVESVSVEGVSAIIHAAIPDPTRIRDWIAEADLTASRDTRQAILLYGDVIDAEPGNLRALVARGRLYLDRGDYTRAASDFLKAEARAPSNVDVQVSLGDLFFARKEYGRATAYFDTAVQTDPGNATAWYRRGLTRYYRREFQPALDDLERARKLDAGLPSIDSFIDKARRRQL